MNFDMINYNNIYREASYTYNTLQNHKKCTTLKCGAPIYNSSINNYILLQLFCRICDVDFINVDL